MDGFLSFTPCWSILLYNITLVQLLVTDQMLPSFKYSISLVDAASSHELICLTEQSVRMTLLTVRRLSWFHVLDLLPGHQREPTCTKGAESIKPEPQMVNNRTAQYWTKAFFFLGLFITRGLQNGFYKFQVSILKASWPQKPTWVCMTTRWLLWWLFLFIPTYSWDFDLKQNNCSPSLHI